MLVVLHGTNLPGRSACSAEGTSGNVHVGVQVRSEPTDLVAADADAARWEVDVRVVAGEDRLDFRGPAVHGPRGARVLYLTWGEVGPDGTFAMFRRAKLVLDRIDPSVVQAADRPGAALVGTIDLTDDHGLPRCARVDPPALVWSVEPSPP